MKGGESKEISLTETHEKHVMWPPKLVISLTNKEKEEDFLIFKGSSKLPKKPKKRTKFIRQIINRVSPGTWLNKLTLERYEVMEKVSKKRARGLKAMCDMDSESDE